MSGVTSTVQFAVAMGCLGVLLIAIFLAVAFCIKCNSRNSSRPDEESRIDSTRSSLVVLSPRPIQEDSESDTASPDENVVAWNRQRLSTIPESAEEEYRWETIIGDIQDEPRLSRDFTGIGFVINLPGGRMLAE